MKLGRGYLQIIQNFHLEGGKGKTNANPAKQTVIHHHIRLLVFNSRTAYALVLFHQDHLICVGRIHILFCHDPTPGTSMGRIDTEAGAPVVFNNLKIFLIFHARRNIQDSFIDLEAYLDALNVRPFFRNSRQRVTGKIQQ
jgi:hypothetical protein